MSLTQLQSELQAALGLLDIKTYDEDSRQAIAQAILALERAKGLVPALYTAGFHTVPLNTVIEDALKHLRERAAYVPARKKVESALGIVRAFMKDARAA